MKFVHSSLQYCALISHCKKLLFPIKLTARYFSWMVSVWLMGYCESPTLKKWIQQILYYCLLVSFFTSASCTEQFIWWDELWSFCVLVFSLKDRHVYNYIGKRHNFIKLCGSVLIFTSKRLLWVQTSLMQTSQTRANDNLTFNIYLPPPKTYWCSAPAG